MSSIHLGKIFIQRTRRHAMFVLMDRKLARAEIVTRLWAIIGGVLSLPYSSLGAVFDIRVSGQTTATTRLLFPQAHIASLK